MSEDITRYVNKALSSGDFRDIEALMNIGGGQVDDMVAIVSEMEEIDNLLNNVRVEVVDSDVAQIEKILVNEGEGEYALQPFDGEGGEIEDSAEITFGYVPIITKQWGGALPIYKQTLMNHKSKEALADRILTKYTRRMAKDKSKIFVRGDVDSSNRALAYMDGVGKLAESCTVIDAGDYGDTLSQELLDLALFEMGDDYIDQCAVYMNTAMSREFKKMARNDNADMKLMFYFNQEREFYIDGHSMVVSNSFPKYENGSGDLCGDIYITPRMNWGIAQRSALNIELDRVVRKRRTDWTWDEEFGIFIEEPKALIKIKNVKYTINEGPTP
jgi:hypothetical protein